MELFEQIRREYEHGGGTIRGIAKKLGIHRRMVREACSARFQRSERSLRESDATGARQGFCGSDSGSGREDATKATAHRTSDLVPDSSRDAWGADRRVHVSSLRARAKVELRLVSQECSFRSLTAGVKKRKSIRMKRLRTSAERGRRPTRFVCGAWPVAELSIALPDASQQAFLEAQSEGLLILAACSQPFGMTTCGPRRKRFCGGTSERRPRDSSPSDHIGGSNRSSVHRRRATKKAAWKEKADTFAGTIGAVPNAASREELDALLLGSSKKMRNGSLVSGCRRWVRG